MPKQVRSADEARAYVRRAAAEGNGDLLLAAVQEWANCKESEIDDDGRIWIAIPQRGHWLSDDDIVTFVEWDLAR